MVTAQAVAEQERSETRRQFLADAIALLSSSLDYTTTLASLARLAVPEIADWCSITMLDAGGESPTTVVAHVDPAKVELARELEHRFPYDPEAAHGLPEVLRTGRSEVIREITDDMLVQATPDPELLQIMRGLGLRSSMVVPLRARGEILGALTLVAAESGRLFDDDDLSLAEDLAGRAGLAIDNAQLFRQAQQAAAERTAVMERVTDALVFVNTSEQVTFMNKAARRLFGVRMVGEDLGTASAHLQIYDWHGQLVPHADYPSRRALRGETVLDLEWKIITPDGREVFCTASASPVDGEDGNRIGAVVAFHDITERKHAEDALRRLSVELEERVVQRTVELQSANKELEAFAYSVSHDLRAPLRSVDGFSQVLLERYGDQLDAAGTRYLGHLRDAAQEMGQLIDALLQLSRVTRGDMRHECVDLSELARATVAQLREADRDRQVSVQITDVPAAEGDARLLRILLENLLGNAWKFTRHEPQGRLELGAVERGGATVYFVRDNGAGFDMAYAAKLFAPFQRLHGVGDFEGTGIGLATVQRIVHRHGGRLWAEGTVGEGATFYFTLKPDVKDTA